MFDQNHSWGTPATEYVATGGGGGNYINYLKEDVTTLRFYQDYDELLVVAFHYDEKNRLSIPCPGGKFKSECPGCQAGIKPSNRLMAVALDRATGYVNLWGLPISLKESIARVQDRDGTLQARDVTIFRSKVNNRISYDLEREDKEEHVKSVEELPSLQEAIAEAWKYATDEDYRAQKQENRKQRAEEKAESEKTTEKPKEEKDADGPPPFKDAPKDEEGLPRGEMSEAEVRALKYVELVRMADEYGITVDDDMEKQDIADAIIAKLA